MKVKQLPVKPSKLIRLALKDLTSVERSKNYTVDMRNWATRDPSGVCSVCLGGATLMKSILHNPEQANELDWDSVSFGGDSALDIQTGESRRALGGFNIELIEALDSLRGYEFELFLECIQRANQEGKKYKYLSNMEPNEVSEKLHTKVPRQTSYQEDSKTFKNNMRRVAKTLEEIGL